MKCLCRQQPVHDFGFHAAFSDQQMEEQARHVKLVKDMGVFFTNTFESSTAVIALFVNMFSSKLFSGSSLANQTCPSL